MPKKIVILYALGLTVLLPLRAQSTFPAGRVVIAEEGTGTWCAYCPRGTVALDHLESTYPENFQGIAIHHAEIDPMALATYSEGLAVMGLPMVKVDRVFEIDPISIEGYFLDRVQTPASALIKVGAHWDAAERLLTVSLKYDLQTQIMGNWKTALVLTENNVTGSGPGWSQANAYANNANGPMGGYENLPNPVPAAQMLYNHVARLITPSFAGHANSFPSPSQAGESHTLNFYVYVPVGWNVDELQLIGLLINPEGHIDNAGVANLPEAETNGFVPGDSIATASVPELHAPDAAFTLYPNPANDFSFVKIELQQGSEVILSVRDLTGKELFARNYGSLNGSQILPIHTQTLATGIYLVEVQMNGQRYSAKLVKE